MGVDFAKTRSDYTFTEEIAPLFLLNLLPSSRHSLNLTFFIALLHFTSACKKHYLQVFSYIWA